jgi:hypothetical protein
MRPAMSGAAGAYADEAWRHDVDGEMGAGAGASVTRMQGTVIPQFNAERSKRDCELIAQAGSQLAHDRFSLPRRCSQ